MKLSWKHTETVHYTSYSTDMLLNQFQSDTWNQLSEDNRIALIQEMEDRSAKNEGREPAKIVSLHDEHSYGAYDELTNKIQIDVSNCSSYESLDTYIHESNHAYQSHCVDNNLRDTYDERTFGMFQAELARDSQGNLYNYEGSAPLYDLQCSEMDSNNAAVSFLISEKERYQEDLQYAAYMKERADYYHFVNDALEKNREDRMALQDKQIRNAYQEGVYSEEQYRELEQIINDKNSMDEMVLDTWSVQNAVNEVRDGLEQVKEQDMEADRAEDVGSENTETFDYAGSMEAVSAEDMDSQEMETYDYAGSMEAEFAEDMDSQEMETYDYAGSMEAGFEDAGENGQMDISSAEMGNDYSM